MGCGSSVTTNYIVQYCKLEPTQQANTFKIKLLAKEELVKKEGVKFLNQIGQTQNPEVIKFLSSKYFQEKTIFYYYLGVEPLLKTYNQSLKYVPFNLPRLTAVYLLSFDNVPDFPSQIIENKTKYLEESKLVNCILNLNEDKKKLDEANNPNITRDNLSLKEDTVNFDDESIKEKEGEIIISEEVTKNTI